MQSERASLPGKQFECALEGWHSQRGLSSQDAGASCLEIEERGARSTACSSGLCDLLEEFARASIFAFVKGKVRFLQNRRDILCQGFADVTTEHAAH
jgi:hypothetical protein